MRGVRGDTARIIFCSYFLMSALVVKCVQAFTLGCETVWKRPDAMNSVSDCLLDRGRILSHWMYYIYPGIVVLFLVLLLLLFPMMFLMSIFNGCRCCYCCFQTNGAKPFNGSFCLYFSSYVTFLWGICASIAIVIGVNTMHTGAQASLESAIYKSTQYFMDTGNQVMDYATNGTGSAIDLPPAFATNIQVIFNIYTNFLDLFDNIRNNHMKYVEIAVILSYVLSCLPFFLLVFTVIFATRRTSSRLPLCCSCVFFLVGVIYSLFAVAFLGAAYIGSAANDEMDRQIAREPGVLQFYAVPYFDTHFQPNITDLKGDLEVVVMRRVQAACREINEYCDATADFGSKKPFFCQTPVVCRTANDLIHTSRTMPVKDPLVCRPGASDAVSDTMCTIAFCATSCDADSSDEKTRMAHEASVKVMEKVDNAMNATIAYNLVKPLTNSNMIVDTLLWSAGKFPDVREGLWIAGTGCFVATLVFTLSICVMLCGRVAWGSA